MHEHRASQQSDYHSGAPAVQGIYSCLTELRQKGFVQAEPLSALILELNLALIYLCSDSIHHARDRLGMCTARLHHARELLAAPELQGTEAALTATRDAIHNGCEAWQRDRASKKLHAMS